jgi:hypothetical protein
MYNTYGGVMDADKKKKLLIVSVLAVVAIVVAIIIYFVMKTPACPAGQTRDPTSKLCIDTAPATCPAGQSRNTTTNLCIGTAPATCPAGQTRDPTSKLCIAASAGSTPDLTNACPVNYKRMTPNSNCIPVYKSKKLVGLEVQVPFPDHHTIGSYETSQLNLAEQKCIDDEFCQGRLSNTRGLDVLINGVDPAEITETPESKLYFFYKTE